MKLGCGALTMPAIACSACSRQSAWALPSSLFGEELAPSRYSMSSMAVQTSCHLKLGGSVIVMEKWFAHCEECRRSNVCCFVGLLVVVAFLTRINFRFVGLCPTSWQVRNVQRQARDLSSSLKAFCPPTRETRVERLRPCEF